MNKKIILLLVILLTGCGKTVETLNCTRETTTEGNEVVTEIKSEVNKDGIIKNAVSTMTYKDEIVAKDMCDVFRLASDSKYVKCDGKVITIKNYHKSLAGKNKLTKETFLEHMDNNNYTCK